MIRMQVVGEGVAQVAKSTAHLCGEHDAGNAAGVHEAAARHLGWVQYARLQQVLHPVLHLRQTHATSGGLHEESRSFLSAAC